MNKGLKSLLLVFMMTLAMGVNVGCGAIGGAKVGSSEELHKATKDVQVQMVHEAWGSYREYKGSKKDIDITQDFTIMTTDPFFQARIGGEYNNVGRILEKMTLNGNGHTITIKGETNGSLGRYSGGLFGRIQKCEIKDLNIVYDLDLNINGSSGSRFGGLSGDISDSTVTNCNVSYKRKVNIAFWTHKNGYHDSGYGGLVGYTGGATYDNCKVEGELNGTAGYIGGLAAYVYSSTSIKNSVFNGSLTTSYLEESFVGGLAGYSEGKISSSKVDLNKLTIIGEPQAWRARTSSGGGLVGKLKGKLHDCYLDFKEGGYIYAESKNNGTFATTLNKGVLIGEAVAGSSAKNLYADGMKDSKANIKHAENALLVDLGIGKNESTDISNTFYIDDNYSYNYEESFTATKVMENNDYSFTGTIHGMPATVKVVTQYDEERNEYDPEDIVLTIGEDTYNLSTNTPFTSNDVLEIWDNIDNYQYIINIKHNSGDEYTIKFNKNIKYVEKTNVELVNSYDQIVFDLEENVIGGNSNAWKIDPTTKKPLLKTID